ncbi:MAG: Fic family protein [Proteobacteria bacterium]|nr:Fic family protein [Pseudomonadota bacterium]
MQPFEPQQLPIDGIQWDSLIPLIGKANRSLAYYDGILYGLANPDVLLSPLTTQEAVLSSKIEGTQATLGEVLKFEAGEAPVEESRVRDIEEIMNYRRAMRRAEEELKTHPFSLNLLKELHAVLLDGVRGKFKARGQFRTTQNWIGTSGLPIEAAQFVPPAPQNIMPHLDNWEKYYHFDRPDPLVQLAIIHAQFEMIHPFLDGNGRLGRMIVPLFLFERKLISSPVFYISAYLERYREEYVAGLQGLSEKTPTAWTRWIGFFLRAMDEQSRENARKAQAIIDLYGRLKTRIIDLTHSRYAVPLLDCLFDQPVFTSSLFDDRPGMPGKPMIMNMLGRLKKAGILKVVREGSGRRPQILALAELINVCEGSDII